MIKKQYIAPQMEVIEIETVQMLAASNIEVKPGESGTEQLSGKRRGTWGNLWAEDEK